MREGQLLGHGVKSWFKFVNSAGPVAKFDIRQQDPASLSRNPFPLRSRTSPRSAKLPLMISLPASAPSSVVPWSRAPFQLFSFSAFPQVPPFCTTLHYFAPLCSDFERPGTSSPPADPPSSSANSAASNQISFSGHKKSRKVTKSHLPVQRGGTISAPPGKTCLPAAKGSFAAHVALGPPSLPYFRAFKPS